MSHRPTNTFWLYRVCAISTFMYGQFRSFLGGGAVFFAAKDDEPASVFLKGQCPIMASWKEEVFSFWTWPRKRLL
jgi:hypothetical protein